jgi:hypothetical protein
MMLTLTDVNFRTVSRIDIPTSGVISTAGAYSLGAATLAAPPFPGSLNFFNGDQSTLLKTVGGTITFKNFGSHAGDRISGSFSATVEDGNATSTPKASYLITANFDFVTGSYGPALPAATSGSHFGAPRGQRQLAGKLCRFWSISTRKCRQEARKRR